MIIPAQVLLLLFGTVVLYSSSPALSAVRRNKKCSPFPYASLEHGRIISTGTQKYKFLCNRGYDLSLASPQQVRCFRGNWSSDKQPQCVKPEGNCDDPISISGGQILGDERHVGSTVLYMCDPGFTLMGKGQRVCVEGGHWSGVTPSCMDESEPLQKVAERLRDKFIAKIGSHSSDSTGTGRSLDPDSIQGGLELVILLDRSSSIDPEDFKMGINFLKFLLQTFGVRNGNENNNSTGTRAAVITFGSKADIIFNLDNATITGPLAANRVLDTIKAEGGGTAMEEAFMTLYTDLPPLREKAKRALFMITDGEPNNGTLNNTIYFATKLKENNKNFEIFTVGIGRSINRKILSKLASEPAISHVFILNKYSDLGSIMETIQDRSRKAKVFISAKCGFIKHPEHFLKRWPWLAAIYIGFKDKKGATQLNFCTGTLICDQWVITAASCFFQVHEVNSTLKVVINSTKEVFIVFGEKDLTQEDRNQINFYAQDVHIHPEFKPFEDLQNNLALVKLNAPVPLQRFHPACLPPTSRFDFLHLNINASIAGWGLRPPKTNGREINGGTVRVHVSNTSATLEEDNECAVYNGKVPKQYIFCAGTGEHSCIGDLGSPIIAVDPATKIHHLIGVESRRSNCHRGVNQYADLSKFVGWINLVTNQC